MTENFSVNTRISYGYEIFDIEGDLEKDDLIRIENIIKRGVPEGSRVILNMERVSYISSTGLSYLINMKKDLPVNILIMSADEKLMSIFYSNKAMKLFDFVKNEKALMSKEKSKELDDILNDPGES